MTGVAFSECALPQFNVELKQQIDNFLSRHGPSVCLGIPSLGRTLGSATEIVQHLSSIEKPVKPLVKGICVYVLSVLFKINVVACLCSDRLVLGRAWHNECSVRY